MIERARRGLAAIPRGVWVLGTVSLCMDASSELIHSLLPLYLAAVLGASTLTIGIIEGIAEATALIVKVFSGVLSDVFRRRKPLVVAGYGLAAVTKLAFPLATTLGWIVGARFADRVGKGIRGAPRDALIADLTPENVRGASFGLRQALDTVGAVAGPLLAIVAMAAFAGDFQAVFWVAVVPAFISVALLVGGVSEPDRASRRGERREAAPAARRRQAARPHATRSSSPSRRCSRSPASRRRSSSSARAMRACRSARCRGSWSRCRSSMRSSAYPAGAAADRGHGPRLLSAGLVALIVADLVLARAERCRAWCSPDPRCGDCTWD